MALTEINEAVWQDCKRRDGLTVHEQPDGTWAIRPLEGASVVSCPCCDRLLRSRRMAMILAETMFPFRRPAA
jgi:hypothetical protein